MAGRKQLVVQPPVRTYGLGSASTADLYALYPASPVYSGELTDEVAEKNF